MDNSNYNNGIILGSDNGIYMYVEYVVVYVVYLWISSYLCEALWFISLVT